jgi:NADH-quinone oxidoreductase subunit J
MIIFYIAAALTVLTTGLAITRANPVHALLWFVLSLLCMAVIFFMLGAPFAAALEVIVYAGAIMVLFLFVILMLALDKAGLARERSWIAQPIWIVPLLLTIILGVELGRPLLRGVAAGAAVTVVSPQAVGLRLFTVDLAAVEIASMLLLAALVGAFHLGRRA